jgi:hypothetical protein
MKLVASPTVDGDLVVVGGVHEDEVRAVLVQVLVVAAVNGGGLDLEAGVEGLVNNLAGHHVAHLGPHKGAALAGLDVLEFDDVPELALELQDRSVLNVVSGCHWFPLVSLSGRVVRCCMPGGHAITARLHVFVKNRVDAKIPQPFYR